MRRRIFSKPVWVRVGLFKHVVTVVSREHSVETKGHGGARVRLGLLNIFAFLLIFVTLQSVPSDGNRRNFQGENSAVKMFLNKCSQLL